MKQMPHTGLDGGTIEDIIGLAVAGALEIPAGDAVSYVSSKEGGTGYMYGFIRVTWRHK